MATTKLPIELYSIIGETRPVFATRFDSLALRPACDVRTSPRCTGRAWYRLAFGDRRAVCPFCLTELETAAGVVLQSRPAKAWAEVTS